MKEHPGNLCDYDLTNLTPLAGSPLLGKRILFLGSSVTEGFASMGISFVDYLARRDGILAVKEAVSGTTLVDMGPDSYISRMKRLDPTMPFDLFVCQLSTNDARLQLPPEAIADAINFIISYARKTWGCPVAFYTSPRYENDDYEKMVELLLTIAEKQNIDVIDLWNDARWNDISQARRQLYMADPVHPTRAGYLEWWLPKWEQRLTEIFETS